MLKLNPKKVPDSFLSPIGAAYKPSLCTSASFVFCFLPSSFSLLCFLSARDGAAGKLQVMIEKSLKNMVSNALYSDSTEFKENFTITAVFNTSCYMKTQRTSVIQSQGSILHHDSAIAPQLTTLDSN